MAGTLRGSFMDAEYGNLPPVQVQECGPLICTGFLRGLGFKV